MNRQEEQKNWELAVGEVNKSLDEKEKAEFKKIEKSEETQKASLQAQQVYSISAKAFQIHKINKEKNWKYIESQIFGHKRIRKIFLNTLKYAAVFILALTIGIVLPKLYPGNEFEVGYNTVEMEWGQMGKIILSDNTHVWLNAGTKFEYPTLFNSKQRVVKLDGEAQFSVSHNENLPFEVKTKSGNIKVLGTTFNVSSYKDDPELVVTLIDGKVTVENSNGKLLSTLAPEQQISINKQTGEAILRHVNTEFYSSWIDGKILLQETKLSDLLKILERWYNIEVSLEGEDLGDIVISGTILKSKPLDLFLKILEQMYGIQYELIIHRNAKDEVIIFKN